MTDSPTALNRFETKHRAHGGVLQLVPQNGREWAECSRCGARILVAPTERRDDDEAAA